MQQRDVFEIFGIKPTNPGAFARDWLGGSGTWVESENPTTEQPLAAVEQADAATYEQVARIAAEAFASWRRVPAPRRGEMVRALGDELRAHKEPLAHLVSLEMGKILSEARGEVQEMIDMCDLAVGQSRMLYGLSLHSERPRHRLFEQWHPLGPVGVITSFNFPVAVWAWNAALAAVCGDTVIWKPSSHTPLTALAVQHLASSVMRRFDALGVFNLVIGPGREVGQRLVEDPRVPLISFTGSTDQGRRVSEAVARRFGRSILELGGNNAVIVMPDANLDLTVRAVLFAAVGTAGQRCTTLRRLIVHTDIYDALLARLQAAYPSIPIGDPLDEGSLVGPLVDAAAVHEMLAALDEARAQGAEVLYGGTRLERPGHFVVPALVAAPPQLEVARRETFAPILYVFRVNSLEEAIQLNNSVPQGLSSAIFTTNLLAAETFLSAEGSDCGIANVNTGTSGAEIGGAFGGEKETGGGREAGSDAWKQYMRRQTCTINWSEELPLAQGVTFRVP